MAEVVNIDSVLDTIKKAQRGEDVRQAIIEALRMIYNDKEYPPTSIEIKHNGTVTGGPWNKVKVNVDSAKTSMRIDCPKGPITENGYYTLQDLKNIGLVEDPDCDGIDGISVQVGQVNGGFGEKNITENGVYDPLLDGFDGYSKVYVNVLGGEIKDYYTVRFFDGKSLLETKSVPRGTNASYTGNRPLSGTNFTGWNPQPVAVSRDMDCYAQYGTGTTTVLYDRTMSTIMDSWSQICEKIESGNRPYQPGNTKQLYVAGYNGSMYLLNMMLMGYNLDKDVNGKLVSTWININPAIVYSTSDNYVFGRFSKGPRSYGTQFDQCGGQSIWWGSSLIRSLLNGKGTDLVYSGDLTYFNNNAANNILFPNALQVTEPGLWTRIKEVVKYSGRDNLTRSGSTTNVQFVRDNPTNDKIWLASSRELAYYTYTINGNGATPSTTIGKSMCSIGHANSTNLQYGNPNTLAAILGWFHTDAGYGLINGEILALRDIDNTDAVGSGSCAYRIAQLGCYDVNNIPTFIFRSNAANYIDVSTQAGWLPIGFCI